MAEAEHREQLIEILRPLNPQFGAEIGVQTGKTSAALLAEFPALKLCMVDRWAPPLSDSEYFRRGDPAARMTQDEYLEQMHEAHRRTNFARERAWLIAYESPFATRFVTDPLDFAFIDADHTYDAVLADFRAWWPKIRSNGILAGHDYGNETEYTRDVKPAVDEFAKEVGAAVNVGRGFVCWINKE